MTKMARLCRGARQQAVARKKIRPGNTYPCPPEKICLPMVTGGHQANKHPLNKADQKARRRRLPDEEKVDLASKSAKT